MIFANFVNIVEAFFFWYKQQNTSRNANDFLNIMYYANF